MQWSVTLTFEGANHHPNVSVSGGLDRTARRGEVVMLNANATDPDGDALTYKWWQYPEADTYPGRVTFDDPTSARSSLPRPGRRRSAGRRSTPSWK